MRWQGPRAAAGLLYLAQVSASGSVSRALSSGAPQVGCVPWSGDPPVTMALGGVSHPPRTPPKSSGPLGAITHTR